QKLAAEVLFWSDAERDRNFRRMERIFPSIRVVVGRHVRPLPPGKSLVSSLVGAAIEDGYIKSIDDPVTRYIPKLKGSAYEGVTVRQLLTMTSGVKWNEDYTDPKSDVARMLSTPAPP